MHLNMNLKDKLESNLRILPAQQKALERIGVNTIEDLLYYFPRGYGDESEVTKIKYLEKGHNAIIFGEISKLKTKKAFNKKIPMAEAVIKDETGSIKIIWFHQAYLAKILEDGSRVRVEGKVSERKGSIYFSNPKVEPVATLFSKGVGHHIYPVYPETKGISSNWLYHKIQQIFSSGVLDKLTDPIPEKILNEYKLPSLKTAMIWLHTPQKREHAEAARKRFAFEEIFLIQIEKQKIRAESEAKNAFIIDKKYVDIEAFVERFPFKATNAQKKAVENILADFSRGFPMSRLLEGDVGSGKTAVAATASYAVTTSRPKEQNFGTLQTAYMAPTEILAQQHFESFIKYFSHLAINIALITGGGCKKFPSKINPTGFTDISRAQLLKWVSTGEISIVIGTHALIQKSVKFKHLALAIVDEQHRFGTAQRQKLVTKSEVIPHLLSMTATPIPRTLALTLYGDLDLTLLDEMPAGRKKINTSIISPGEREKAYEKIREELKAGRQLYVICPRIDEPDPNKEMAMQTKDVKSEAKRLKSKIFPEYRIEVLHSKMKPTEKEKIMEKFKNHEIDILVSTSVIEVGVSVENASLIIIEGAERFGLSQLHQLRGRVLRGNHEPYCFIFADAKSEKTTNRLKALITAKNGFELAEYDLESRGAGALAGKKQWGISDLGMEAIKNLKMVEFARKEAQKIIDEDLTLEKHPILLDKISKRSQKIHFE